MKRFMIKTPAMAKTIINTTLTDMPTAFGALNFKKNIPSKTAPKVLLKT